MEKARAAYQGEPNDAKSPFFSPGGPAIPLPSQQSFHSPFPEMSSCMSISFLQFQLQFFRAGNHVVFPSGKVKNYWKRGIPCAVIELMLALARCLPGRDISKAALL